jgi:hypothetical protein
VRSKFFENDRHDRISRAVHASARLPACARHACSRSIDPIDQGSSTGASCSLRPAPGLRPKARIRHGWPIEQGPYWVHASSVLGAGRFGRFPRSSVCARDLLPDRSSSFFPSFCLPLPFYLIVCLNRLLTSPLAKLFMDYFLALIYF